MAEFLVVRQSALLVIAAALATAAVPLKAGDIVPLDWSQLTDPKAQEFEDPYRDLNSQQMSDLMSLLRVREELVNDALAPTERSDLEARANRLEAGLQAAGIDVDWLLEQRWVVADRRRQAAVAVNRALDGERVELAGFLVSAAPTDNSVVAAYLLPDRGVCGHLPPPLPNQLVRLELTSPPESSGFCVPTVVRGILRAHESRYEVFVIDDAVPMWSAWTLEVNELTYDR